MSELIEIPTVEQINLEHQLANSKANEAVQHATNCGLMLLQVKASLSHGGWLPWLKQQQESGLIGFSHMTATKYMRLAANINRDLYLPETTSIRAALELLSDKEPDEKQGELIDVEAERKAREEAEAELEAEKSRSSEWREQALAKGKENQALELKFAATAHELHNLKVKPVPEPVIQTVEKIVEKPVIPPEFASLEEAIAAKQRELDRLGRDTQKVLNHNKVVYESRAALQQDVDDLTLLLSRHKAAERELVEHKRITDNVAHFCATLLVDVHALEHAPDDAQLQRWEQAIQQLQDSAIAVQSRLHYPSLEGELVEAA